MENDPQHRIMSSEDGPRLVPIKHGSLDVDDVEMAGLALPPSPTIAGPSSEELPAPGVRRRRDFTSSTMRKLRRTA